MPDVPAPPADARYLVSARKYRPQTFGDLVAQEHVAETLRNAVGLARLAHAYLFCGPRGVGKTTAARLLAKAVNCQIPLADRDRAEPCRTCPSCRDFEEGRSMNIIEIDAASNNKVDDIRELRETVRVPPQGAKKKIYILDEVHMLSAGAFNALLKTLEEPPEHVLFIFATTEPHKVLPTILSRCQRFDFRRISVPETVGRLVAICAEEGVEADAESLVLIARKGDGALRDALSLFDQALALCGSPLVYADLRDALGVVDTDLYFAATDRAAAGNRAGLLHLVDAVVRRGYDLTEFVGGLAEHLRNLLVARTTGTADLIEASETVGQRYLQAAGVWAEPDLLHLLMLADEAETALKTSRQPRLTVELALLKMASLERAVDLERLIAGLGTAEERRAEPTEPTSRQADEPRKEERIPVAAMEPEATYATVGDVPTVESPAFEAPPAPAFVPAPPREPVPASAAFNPAPPPEAYESEASLGQTEGSRRESDARPSEAPPPYADDASDDREDDRPDDPSGGEPPLFPSTPPVRPHTTAPPSRGPDRARRARIVRRRSRAPPASTRLHVRRRRRLGRAGAPEAMLSLGAVSPDGPTARPADEPVPDEAPLARVLAAWPAVVAAARKARVHVGALAAQAAPHAAPGTVEIAVPDAFAADLLLGQSAFLAGLLGEALKEEPPTLRFVVRAPTPDAPGATSSDPYEALGRLRQEHPVFRTLFEKFGAEPVYQ